MVTGIPTYSVQVLDNEAGGLALDAALRIAARTSARIIAHVYVWEHTEQHGRRERVTVARFYDGRELPL